MDLEGWSTRLKVFADATRVRLLSLLEREELTVAELAAITQLAQPGVSTHLSKLKEAGLVRDRRAGVSAYYRYDEAALDPAQRALWQSIAAGSDDPLLRQDAERLPDVIDRRLPRADIEGRRFDDDAQRSAGLPQALDDPFSSGKIVTSKRISPS